jgi:predicted enzyme related to lactoylglutathione lyase
VYFTVADADASVAQATGLGASVVVPAKDSPYGRFAGLRDPQGATFYVVGAPEAQ